MDDNGFFYAFDPSEYSSKFIGKMSSGDTIDVFFKVIFNKTSNSGNIPQRKYEVTISGYNPIDCSKINSNNITGTLQLYRTPVTNYIWYTIFH